MNFFCHCTQLFAIDFLAVWMTVRAGVGDDDFRRCHLRCRLLRTEQEEREYRRFQEAACNNVGDGDVDVQLRLVLLGGIGSCGQYGHQGAEVLFC